MTQTRSEITSWLYGGDVRGLDDKNPIITITDGVHEYSVLSIYEGDEKKPTIYIDIGRKK